MFLAGCRGAAVLRLGVRNCVTQYEVVGKAAVCLSKSDKAKYRAFAEDHLLKSRWWSRPEYDEAHDRYEYDWLIRQYQKQDWWQKFLVV